MKRSEIYNPYLRADLQGFRQALEMTNRRYRVIRQTVNKFNDKGRPESIQKIDYINATITKSDDIRTDKRDGKGGWQTETFEIAYCYPEYLRAENIVEHPQYGQLKVGDINDMREHGVSIAKAVRIGSIRNIHDRGE